MGSTSNTSAIIFNFDRVISDFAVSTIEISEREIPSTFKKSSCLMPFSFLILFKFFANFCKKILVHSLIISYTDNNTISDTDIGENMELENYLIEEIPKLRICYVWGLLTILFNCSTIFSVPSRCANEYELRCRLCNFWELLTNSSIALYKFVLFMSLSSM